MAGDDQRPGDPKTLCHHRGVSARWIVQVGLELVLTAAIALWTPWCYHHLRGIEIRVHNATGANIRSVEVRNAAGTAALDDLGLDETDSAYIKPDSDDALMVTFVDGQGHRQTYPIHEYLEPGYSGYIAIDVTDRDATITATHVDPF